MCILRLHPVFAVSSTTADGGCCSCTRFLYRLASVWPHLGRTLKAVLEIVSQTEIWYAKRTLPLPNEFVHMAWQHFITNADPRIFFSSEHIYIHSKAPKSMNPRPIGPACAYFARWCKIRAHGHTSISLLHISRWFLLIVQVLVHRSCLPAAQRPQILAWWVHVDPQCANPDGKRRWYANGHDKLLANLRKAQKEMHLGESSRFLAAPHRNAVKPQWGGMII